MRSFRLTSVLCLVLLLLAPKPAQAWFEWLDALSGPGKFYGVVVDFRIKCWGKSSGFDELDQHIANALFETRNVAGDKQLPVERQAAIQKLWDGVCHDFDVVQARLGGMDTLKMCGPTGSITVFKSKIPGVSDDEILTMTRELRDFIDPLFTRLVALASTGIVVSLCEHDRMRTFALELGLSTMQANSDPNFAHDYTIRLDMYTAGLSYRIPSKRFDVVDIGARGGAYVFSSRGFDTFGGALIKGLADLHVPNDWLEGNSVQKAFTYLIFRANVIWFVGGFDTAKQFAAIGDGVEIVPGSKPHFSGTILFNVTPLLLRHVPPLPKKSSVPIAD